MRNALRRVLAIAGVGLLRLSRDRTSLFFVFLLPLMIIVLIGAANPGRELPVGIVRDDDGRLAREFVRSLDGEHISLRQYGSRASLQRGIRHKEVVAGVVVPAGYDTDLRTGRDATVTVLGEPGNSDSTAVSTRVADVVAEQGGVVGAARFALSEIGTGDFAELHERAGQMAARIERVEVRSTTAGDDPLSRLSVFDYATFGELLLFLFITALSWSGDAVETRRLGVTRRILASPASPTVTLLAYGLELFATLMLEAAIIIGVGAILFGVEWGDPFAAAALVGLFGVVAAGMGLLVATIARTNEQATSIGPPIGIALGMLGGCLWPLEIVPPAMRAVGHLTPHAWAVDAFVDLVGKGAGIGGIGPQLGALALFAAVLLPLGVLRLRRSITG